jgi:hypothetical protein
MKRVLIAVSGALLALLAMAPPPAASAEAAPGMVVVRDPKTGELRAATPAESRLMRQQSRTPAPDPTDLVLTVRGDGSRKVHLGERRQVYAVVTRDADGQPAMHCVHTENAAQALLDQPATSAKELQNAR